MSRPARAPLSRMFFRLTKLIVCGIFVFAFMQAASAQTLNVLHTFTGGADGGSPPVGLTQDRAGNLYGMTQSGGAGGNCAFGECGVVFKVSHSGTGWVELPIYTFKGSPDGSYPQGRLIIGRDGALYGTTKEGGPGTCNAGCGTVFKLQPPISICATIVCPWRETILYTFNNASDGAGPEELVFDQAGNLYGATAGGGSGTCSCGTVFELTHNSGGGWTKSTLYSFQGGQFDGKSPGGAMVFDQAGNLYGSTAYGFGTGCVYQWGCGTLFELSPSGNGWTERLVHVFTGGDDGEFPGGLIRDGSGNLYGAASNGPGEFGYGTVYKLTPSQGQWIFSVIYTVRSEDADYPTSLTLDANGDFYWSGGGGINGNGEVGKLMNANGVWSFQSLYSFAADGSQGFFPTGSVLLDTQGNMYGTNFAGPYPSPDAGTVWQLTP